MQATSPAPTMALGVALALGLALALAPADSALAAVIYTYQANPPALAGSPRRVTPASATPRPAFATRAHSASATRATRQLSAGGSPSSARAPSGPPLTSSVLTMGGAESTVGVPSAEGDQLVENGLSSPFCKGSPSGGLSGPAQSNCRTSAFVGAPAPTNDYDLDVNIDVGAFGLSGGELLSVIQDVFIAPLWKALVWIVHALVVMLEWSYTLELLSGSTMSGIASSLRKAQASFTQPWLALVLAATSVLAVYNGLIRRRVSETLGQTLMTIVMMAGGLWVIANPLATVGTIGRWANQTSLGTLGAVAQGTPANAPRALAEGMRALFSSAIEKPWCYLEFGNVRWCSAPALLDSSLRSAALRIVTSQQAQLKCGSIPGAARCLSSDRLSALAVEHREELVREADTNGGLFLAFPANEAERNSVKGDGSLLHVLCQAKDDTKCKGATAAQAEFRSAGGTFPRMIGVALISAGGLGMVMLLGFVTVRLLEAAIAGLFMLLLAPFAVLAPGLGDGGRALFGVWTKRLLGAVTSKLVYSFLLGALLTMQRMLASLQPLGWWTDWLLMSAFWWGVFLKRHRALAFMQSRGRQPAAQRSQSIARRAGAALETPRAMLGAAGWAKRKILSPAPDVESSRKRAHTTLEVARERADEQTKRTLEHDHAEASELVQAGPRIQGRLSSERVQLDRVHRARESALARGDRRRAVKLAVRARRLEAQTARDPQALTGARKTVTDAKGAQRQGGSTHRRAQREERARFLDAQAALPSSSQHRRGEQRRDYVALAGLAGYGRQEYERLSPRAGREAHLRIDRELAMRSQLAGAAYDAARASVPALGRREQRKTNREFDRALEERTRANGGSLPGPPPPRASTGTQGSSDVPRSTREAIHSRKGHSNERRTKSIVMDDAREVAARRKRQLGRRPDA